MGLVPKQYSTGGKAKLAGISKRGNHSYGVLERIGPMARQRFIRYGDVT
jgi:transposase